MSPKPAYEALHSLIKGKWWTKVDVPTDDAGEAKLQGFLGEYDVTVSHAGQSAKRSFTLEKEGNEWMIVLVN